MSHVFTRFTSLVSWAMGHPMSFALALGVVVVWAATGPLFGFSDTWQLVINTGTTIVTFLMVFLIQNTQNRQGDAIQLKLDELIRAGHGAHNYLLNVEDSSEEELSALKAQYRRLHELAGHQREQGSLDTDSPEL